jgi:hypothetical protein
MVRVKLPMDMEMMEARAEALDSVVHWRGEILDPANIDQLIDVYEQATAVANEAYAIQRWIRQRALELTHGDAKTRRLVGRRRKAKLTMPDDAWDQGRLKEAFNSFPQYRDDVLAIASLRVRLREFKKLANSSGEPSFNLFRDMVVAANNGPQGLPRLAVEE